MMYYVKMKTEKEKPTTQLRNDMENGAIQVLKSRMQIDLA